MTIQVKAQMFKHGHPRVGVTKSWLTNNHWAIHKSLLDDPLPFLTVETTQDWVKQYITNADSIEFDLAVTETDITKTIAGWIRNGDRAQSPEPWPSVYSNEHKQRVKVYELPGTKAIRLMCIHSNYYKLFKSHLTHLLIQPHSPEDGRTDADTLVERCSLTNADHTFFLRPFRESKASQLTLTGSTKERKQK